MPWAGSAGSSSTAMVLYSDNSETVEWINMCWRKAWRVYQRGLEKWIAGLLQPVFDNLIAEAHVRCLPRPSSSGERAGPPAAPDQGSGSHRPAG